MKASPSAAKIGKNIERGVGLYGDLIWEALCDHFRPGQIFTITECEPIVLGLVGQVSVRYARELARGTLRTVLDQGKGAVKRYGASRWSV